MGLIQVNLLRIRQERVPRQVSYGQISSLGNGAVSVDTGHGASRLVPSLAGGNVAQGNTMMMIQTSAGAVGGGVAGYK